MRNFDVSGLTPEALAQVYELVLTQKLLLENKVERMKKELAVAMCAIDDGKVDLATVKKGLENLFVYCDTKVKLVDELTKDDLVDKAKAHEELFALFNRPISQETEDELFKNYHVVLEHFCPGENAHFQTEVPKNVLKSFEKALKEDILDDLTLERPFIIKLVTAEEHREACINGLIWGEGCSRKSAERIVDGLEPLSDEEEEAEQEKEFQNTMKNGDVNKGPENPPGHL